MTATVYVFRRIRESASDEGVWELGIAVVSSLKDLFWTLDTFGNPYDFEYRPARVGDALHTWQRDESEETAQDLGYMPEFDSCFATDHEPALFNHEWPTFSEEMQDQSDEDWQPVERGMGY